MAKKPANAAPDWSGDDEGEEVAASATTTAPKATPATGSKTESQASQPDMHPGWEGGNVGRVTATPQVANQHPPVADEADEALPEPPAPPVARVNKFALPSTLPTSYAESHALLMKLNAISVTSEAEAKDKSDAMKVFGPHYHRVQQGLPTVDIGSVEYGKSAVGHNVILQRQRIEELARTDLQVAELLKSFDDLVKAHLALRAKYADLTAKIENETK